MFPRYIRSAATAWLVVCVAAVVAFTLRWHAVSDLPQINYICFLMHHGMTLYRDILEVNMPGTFLVNCSLVHLFGPSDLAFRLFDLVLLAVAGLAMYAIARPYSWFGGVLSAALFTLLHGHGGEEQLAQRDLMVAVLVLLAYAFGFAAMRRRRDWPLLFAGGCMCGAATIKPPIAAMVFVLLPVLVLWLRREDRRLAKPLVLLVAGAAVPLLAVFWFLARQHAVAAFLHTVMHILPAYSGIGRRSVSYLLHVSKIIPLLFLWMALATVLALRRRERKAADQIEISLLAFGTFFGVAYYFIQGKGFPYHLYPLAAFAILWSSLEIAQGIGQRGAVRALAYGGLTLGLVLAPVFAIDAIRAPALNQRFNQALSEDVNALGGAQLSGHVQCLATSGECDGVLGQMGLVQSTGLIYDFMVFGNQTTPIQQEMRQRVWGQLQRNPPQVFVVRSYLWPNHPCSLGIAPDDTAAWEQARYGKLRTWPEFAAMLAQHYRLDRERTIATISAPCRFTETYRIYVRQN